MQIKFKKVNENAKIPTQASPKDAFDLYATEDAILVPGERKLFKTGIQVELPDGYYGRVAPRSGLAYKYGIDVLAGVIDEGYRGEIGVILINLDFNLDPETQGEPFLNSYYVKAGDKIAQLNIEKHGNDCDVVVVDELSETERGEKGFGDSGR